MIWLLLVICNVVGYPMSKASRTAEIRVHWYTSILSAILWGLLCSLGGEQPWTDVIHRRNLSRSLLRYSALSLASGAPANQPIRTMNERTLSHCSAWSTLSQQAFKLNFLGKHREPHTRPGLELSCYNKILLWLLIFLESLTMLASMIDISHQVDTGTPGPMYDKLLWLVTYWGRCLCSNIGYYQNNLEIKKASFLAIHF